MTIISNKKQLTLYLILLTVIIVIFNLVSRTLFVRFDLTENNIYSLSNSSKKVIEKLDDRMVAKVFFSKDLPGQLANSRRYLQDLLEEYEAYSKGRFHFEFIAPDQNEEARTEARNYGIPPMQAQVIENDKLEIKNIYMGLVLLYSDKKETLPVIQTSEGLEYNLTAAIKKLAETDMKTVGLVSSDNKSIATTKLQQLLRQTYNVGTVSLDNEIPLDIHTLLLNGFQDSVSIDQLYNIDQYLMRGGKLFVGQARQVAHLQDGYASEIKSNIFDFLEHYGFRIGNDILVDKQCGQISIQQRRGFFSFSNAVNYQVFPLIHKFNKDNIIVKSLEQVRLFFVNEVLPVDSTVQFTSLMSTSQNTGALSLGMVPQMSPYGQYNMIEGYNISPHIPSSQMNNPAMVSFPLKSKAVAAVVDGSFHSYFAENSDFNQKGNFLGLGEDVQILLVGDNEFFNDNRAGGIPENTDFILNSIDCMSGDQELVEIRSRTVTARPLKQLSDGSRRFWKWLNIFLPALLVIIFGLLRWRKNVSKRKLLESIYG
ncbi:MAG: GldG family protein [Candidatus Marinimicrobia bacterium]|nr:GldG family protein [Candidatus Neomarinimicrobiota bacterium]